MSTQGAGTVPEEPRRLQAQIQIAPIGESEWEARLVPPSLDDEVVSLGDDAYEVLNALAVRYPDRKVVWHPDAPDNMSKWHARYGPDPGLGVGRE
jgi:hypothetical protein